MRVISVNICACLLVVLESRWVHGAKEEKHREEQIEVQICLEQYPVSNVKSKQTHHILW